MARDETHLLERFFFLEILPADWSEAGHKPTMAEAPRNERFTLCGVHVFDQKDEPQTPVALIIHGSTGLHYSSIHPKATRYLPFVVY